MQNTVLIIYCRSRIKGHNLASIKIQLEKVTIAKHCNLRPPDVALVVGLFSALLTGPYTMFAVYPFLTYNIFADESLGYAVTLTSDPLTLNACSVSAVT